jgi:MFS family permease
LLITAAGILLFLYSSSHNTALVALIVIGVGVAASFPVILGYIGQIYANLSGTAFSIAFVIALSGNTLANYLFGIISNSYGTKQLPVCLLSIIGCLFVLILLIRQNISSKIKM